MGLFRLLHVVLLGTEALVYNNYPREAAASTYLAIIFVQIASGVPWFPHSTAVPMQPFWSFVQPHSTRSGRRWASRLEEWLTL